MRTPTTGVAAQLTNVVTQSGYLLKIIQTDGTPVRLCSLDVDFSFVDPDTGTLVAWTSNSIDISGISWDQAGVLPGKMVLNDSDLIFWEMALFGLLSDATVSIWQCYAGAPQEAESLWAGRIGAITKGELEIECALIPDNALRLTPIRRVQYIIPVNFMIAPGTLITVGSQQWVVPGAPSVPPAAAFAFPAARGGVS